MKLKQIMATILAHGGTIEKIRKIRHVEINCENNSEDTTWVSESRGKMDLSVIKSNNFKIPKTTSAVLSFQLGPERLYSSGY